MTTGSISKAVGKQLMERADWAITVFMKLHERGYRREDAHDFLHIRVGDCRWRKPGCKQGGGKHRTHYIIFFDGIVFEGCLENGGAQGVETQPPVYALHFSFVDRVVRGELNDAVSFPGSPVVQELNGRSSVCEETGRPSAQQIQLSIRRSVSRPVPGGEPR